MIEEELDCRRIKKVIAGGNYYIAVGTEPEHEFIQATIPRENEWVNREERIAVDEECERLTADGYFGAVAVDMLVNKILSVRRV